MAASKSPAKPERMERLEARITRKQKELLQFAAALQGSSVSEFVVQAASDAATRVIRNDHIITLTMQQHAAFIKALSSPPRANPRLQAAFRRHRKHTKS